MDREERTLLYLPGKMKKEMTDSIHTRTFSHPSLPSRWELTAFLAAISLFCSSLEYMIPKPLPFFRLGLANLPLILALPVLGWKDYLWLMLLKTLGQGLVNGTLFSFQIVLSAASTLASAPLMRLIWWLGGKKKSFVGPIGISIIGALASNIAQLMVAQLFFFGSSIWMVAPPLFALGLATSFIVGYAGAAFMHASRWYARLAYEGVMPDRFASEHQEGVPWRPDKSMLPVALGLIALPALFLQTHVIAQTLSALLCILLALSAGRRFRLTPPLMLTLSMLLLSLLQPSGRILYQWGIIQITEDALLQGWGKAMLLVSLIYASMYMTSGRPSLPGRVGRLVSMQFAYFGILSSGWSGRKKHTQDSSPDQKKYHHLFSTIDDILFDAAYGGASSAPSLSKRPERKVPSIILSAILVILLYLFLLIF